jgi:hypothetical protein
MKKLIFLLLPLFLWAAEHPRKKQINLVQAWTNPNDQGFVQGGLLGDIYKNLQ